MSLLMFVRAALICIVLLIFIYCYAEAIDTFNLFGDPYVTN